MAKRKAIDWDAIYREYRAGQLSIREIAAQFGCSHTAIQKKAKKGEWKRDLSDAVRKAVARKTVAKVAGLQKSATDEEIIEAVGNRGAEVNDIHRKDINQSQTIVRILQGQLVDVINNREDIEEAIFNDTEQSPGDENKPDFKRRNQMLRAVSLPTHISALKDLATAQKTLIALERQAFNIDGEEEENRNKITFNMVNAPPEFKTIEAWVEWNKKGKNAE